ncbi:MAG: Gfo/Idh/MocA family protein [Spirochaetia bacterium]
MERTGIGIIGCGNISGIYLTNLTTRFVHTRVVACADLNRERSQAAADKYGVARAETVEELLRDPEVEIVVNLTPPRAHMEVSRAALGAGKHVTTHVAAVLDFASGAIGTLMMSFDVWGAHLQCMEIYGTEGSLAVPDPNTFGGPVKLLKRDAKEWDEMPLQFGYTENSRGLGVADMADAIRADRPHRASGELLFHVLDVMEGIHDASRAGRHYLVSSTFECPAPLPLGLVDGQISS